MLAVHIYHNATNQFTPYEDGDPLVLVFSLRMPLRGGQDVRAVAEQVFALCNVDLDDLDAGRDSVDGETAFLAACVYRLLGCRSLSVGDVLHLEHEFDSHWLACDRTGWRPISEPARSSCGGQATTAATVYQHLASRSAPA